MTSEIISREKWAKDFPARGRASGSILDYIRITPPSETIVKMLCSPGWIYTPSKGFIHRMNCKRRTCEDCGWFWAWRWRKALKEKAQNDFDLGKSKADKALTLTFAENIPYLLMQRILEWFWENLRRGYPGLEYWGAVEFNQAHTIPHLHFILANAPYLELDYLDYCWKSAQKRAKLQHLAWNLRIEKIRKNTEAYFTKYVTKLLGGKDEIPRRENWGGRFVRYSRGFFPIPVNAMLAGKKFANKLAANDDLDRVFWHVRKPMASLSGFLEKADLENYAIDALALNKWDPAKEKGRAIALKPPEWFDTVDTILVTIPVAYSEDFHKKLTGYNYGSKSGREGPAF